MFIVWFLFLFPTSRANAAIILRSFPVLGYLLEPLRLRRGKDVRMLSVSEGKIHKQN